MITKVSISEAVNLWGTMPFFDVRSPSEFNHAHLPQAIALPLFTDDERKVIGTTYKQISQKKAIKYGLQFFGPKLLNIVETVENHIDVLSPSPNILVYCWRGGMRSSAVAWLLNLYGYHVYQLDGGYKAFRNFTLDQLEEKYTFTVVTGLTGAGKTDFLHKKRSEGFTTIDLEHLANHRGSAFGHLGLGDQPSQEHFENLLAINLFMYKEENIWVEDESQRIGHVYIPKTIFTQMQTGKKHNLDCSFEERLENTLTAYGHFSKIQLIEAIQRINKRLGGKETSMCTQFIEEGNTSAAFTILLQYYDRWYSKNNTEIETSEPQ